MYGGEQEDTGKAMKAAANELLGLHLLYVGTMGLKERIHFPMMALFDYCGFRIIACSLLPINQNTLKYGSCDGGKTINCEDEKLADLIKQTCTKVGLDSHLIKEKLIYGPGDIEGHLGTDGKYYMLDFSRVCPPEAPPLDRTNHDARSVFYKVLRPELVMKHKTQTNKSLCSDAFTGWNMWEPNREKKQNQVRFVTEWLKDEIIPKFTQRWEQKKFVREYLQFADYATQQHLYGKEKLHTTSELYHISYQHFEHVTLTLKEELHTIGINFRHLGLMVKHLKSPVLKKYIAALCAARACKNIIRREMRETMKNRSGIPSEKPFTNIVYKFISMLIGIADTNFVDIQAARRMKGCLPKTYPCSNKTVHLDEDVKQTYEYRQTVYHNEKTSKKCRQFWRTDIKALVQDNFNLELTEEEKDPEYDYRQSIQIRTFYMYLLHILDVDISVSSKKSLIKNPMLFILLKTDILGIGVRVKRTYMGEMGLGLYNLTKGMQCIEATDLGTAKRHLKYAKKSLKGCLNAVPFCPYLNFQYARCLCELAKMSNNKQQKYALYERCYEKYEASLISMSFCPLPELYPFWKQTLTTHAAELFEDEGDSEEVLALKQAATKLELLITNKTQQVTYESLQNAHF